MDGIEDLFLQPFLSVITMDQQEHCAVQERGHGSAYSVSFQFFLLYGFIGGPLSSYSQVNRYCLYDLIYVINVTMG